ncbi:MAG: ATP-binding protein, partial [Calditrichales bacterium]
ANFLLAAAMNPCPCGYQSSPEHECTCQPMQIQKYMSRIDIHIEVPAVKYKELSSDRSGESSEANRERVGEARELQSQRFRSEVQIFCNAHMQSREVRPYCRIDESGQAFLKNTITRLGLSARGDTKFPHTPS